MPKHKALAQALRSAGLPYQDCYPATSAADAGVDVTDTVGVQISQDRYHVIVLEHMDTPDEALREVTVCRTIPEVLRAITKLLAANN